MKQDALRTFTAERQCHGKTSRKSLLVFAFGFSWDSHAFYTCQPPLQIIVTVVVTYHSRPYSLLSFYLFPTTSAAMDALRNYENVKHVIVVKYFCNGSSNTHKSCKIIHTAIQIEKEKLKRSGSCSDKYHHVEYKDCASPS